MSETKDSKKEEKKEEKVEKAEKEEKEEKEEKKAPKAEESKEEEEEIEIPKEFKPIVEQIEKMTVLDLSKLVKILEKRFHVSATPVVAQAAPAAGNGGGEAAGGEAEGKSNYDVVITGAGDQKIQVIKVIRDLTGKGLKDSKDFVDQVAQGPQVVKEAVKKEEAEEMKKKLEEAGATVELK